MEDWYVMLKRCHRVNKLLFLHVLGKPKNREWTGEGKGGK
jgi:hypothetical protein